MTIFRAALGIGTKRSAFKSDTTARSGQKLSTTRGRATIVSGTDCRNKNVAESNDEKGSSTYTVASEKSEKEPGRRK